MFIAFVVPDTNKKTIDSVGIWNREVKRVNIKAQKIENIFDWSTVQHSLCEHPEIQSHHVFQVGSIKLTTISQIPALAAYTFEGSLI